jgi:hypothetical protein
VLERPGHSGGRSHPASVRIQCRAASDVNVPPDGLTDIAVGNFDYRRVTVLQCIGGGAFVISQALAVGNQPAAVLFANLGSATQALLVVNEADNTLMIFQP